MTKAKSKAKKVAKKISAEEFDRRFDEGESMDEYFDWSKGTKSVLVEFPLWMARELDDEAARLGVARQYVIKAMIDDGLEAARDRLNAVSERESQRSHEKKAAAPAPRPGRTA